MKIIIFLLIFLLTHQSSISQEYIKLIGNYKLTNALLGTRQDTLSHYTDTPIQFSKYNILQIKKDSIIINYFEPVKWKIIKEVDVSINTIDLILEDTDMKRCICYIFYPMCETSYYRISILDSNKLNYLSGNLVPSIKK